MPVDYAKPLITSGQIIALTELPRTLPAGQHEAAKGLPAVLDFGRGQCIPCKMMKPILEELGKELAGKVEVKIIDVGEEGETADRFNINIIPTQVFLDAGGKEVYRHEGFMPKEDIVTVLKEKGMM